MLRGKNGRRVFEQLSMLPPLTLPIRPSNSPTLAKTLDHDRKAQAKIDFFSMAWWRTVVTLTNSKSEN